MVAPKLLWNTHTFCQDLILCNEMANEDATKRLMSKKQTLDDAYAAPANFLEIDVINPITHGIGNKRYTDYEVRMKVILSFSGHK